jgi:hypothetical protein
VQAPATNPARTRSPNPAGPRSRADADAEVRELTSSSGDQLDLGAFQPRELFSHAHVRFVL